MSAVVTVIEESDRIVRELEPPGFHVDGTWKNRARYACDDELCGFITLVERGAAEHFEEFHRRSTKTSQIVVTDAAGRPKTED